jgi:hypothetical protein
MRSPRGALAAARLRCTQARARPGGCSWVQVDLCSTCEVGPKACDKDGREKRECAQRTAAPDPVRDRGEWQAGRERLDTLLAFAFSMISSTRIRPNPTLHA